MNENSKQAKIDVGYRIGKLTVVERTDQRRQRYTVWRCRCDCGGEILLDTRYLQRGTVRDCGCGGLTRAGLTDLTGRRFGKLVCLEPTDERGPSGGVVWKCRCDCGNECLAVSTQLTGGYKKSCGCLGGSPLDLTGRRFGRLVCLEPTDERGLSGGVVWKYRCDCGKEGQAVSTQLTSGGKKSCGCLGRPPVKDYIGERFGSLRITGYDGKQKGIHYWRCLCDCGTETVVSQSNLQSGHTKSCGCLQRKIHRKNQMLVDGTSVRTIENRMKSTIKTNTSGYNGVYLNRQTGTWTAQITFKGKTYYLGTYPDIRDAVKARRRGEKMYENFLEWYYNEYQKFEA